MIRRTVGYFFRIAGVFVLLLVAGLLLLAWRVSLAPLRLDFLTPYIQSVLTPDSNSYWLTLGGTTLHLADWQHTLDIRAISVEMRTSTGRPVVTMPVLSLSLSLRALSQGQIALHAIEVQDSCLYLRRTAGGLLALALDAPEGQAPEEAGNTRPFNPGAASATSWLIEELLAPSDPAHPGSALKRIRLTRGTVILDDQFLGATWTATDMNIELIRNPDGISVDGHLLLQTAGEAVPITLAGHQAMHERQPSLTLTFTNLRPATLALPPLQALADIDLSVAGTLSVQLGRDWQVQGGRFLVTGGPGIITLPSPSVTRYDVRSLILQGTIGPDFHSLTLGRGSLDLGGSSLELIASATWTPQSNAVGSSTHLPGNASIPSSSKSTGVPLVDSQSPAFWSAVRFEGEEHEGQTHSSTTPHIPQNDRKVQKGQPPPSWPPVRPPVLKLPLVPPLLPVAGLTIAADVTLHSIPLNNLVRYWPAQVARDPRAWIAANLRDGVIEQARFMVSLSGSNSAGLVVKSLYGILTIRDVTIDYLKPMPPVHHAAAVVTFYPDRLEVQVESGEVQNLRLTEGKIIITGLDQLDQFCAITLTIVGPVPDTLRLLDSKPLGYATALGLRPEWAEGSDRIQLALMFPVEKSLTLKQIDVKAQAQLSDLTLAGLISGRGITHGALAIAVDNEKLHLEGQIELAGAPVRLEWDEFFSRHRSTVRSRYRMHGRLDDLHRTALGLDFAPFVPPFLSGPVETDLLATVGFDDHGTATVEADLTMARIEVPSLGWNKLVGQPGRATACLRFTTSAVQEIPSFAVQAGNEAILSGRAVFTPTGRLDRVTFNRIQTGRTDLTGTLTLTPTDGLDLRLTGPAFDLNPLLRSSTNALSSYASPEGHRPVEPNLTLPDLALELAVARLWGSQAGFLTNATLKAQRESGFWRHGSLEASTEAKDMLRDAAKETAWGTMPRGTLKATLASPPDGSGSEEREPHVRILAVTSEDAGSVLRAFSLFDNIIGGRMQVNAIIDDVGAMRGTLQVKNYRLVNAPILARLLTMAALTGILEALTGDGIRFTSLDMPFMHHDGVLSLTGFRTSGPSLGLTATGKLSPQDGQLKVEGTIVPIYFVNSLLGNIPLLGDLFTGEKGSGLFAATYTMNGTFADPTITVNPLTVVTPGFLRNLFKFFKGSMNETSVPPEVDLSLHKQRNRRNISEFSNKVD